MTGLLASANTVFEQPCHHDLGQAYQRLTVVVYILADALALANTTDCNVPGIIGLDNFVAQGLIGLGFWHLPMSYLNNHVLCPVVLHWAWYMQNLWSCDIRGSYVCFLYYMYVLMH